jgi:hypothetical protein
MPTLDELGKRLGLSRAAQESLIRLVDEKGFGPRTVAFRVSGQGRFTKASLSRKTLAKKAAAKKAVAGRAPAKKAAAKRAAH